MHSFQLMSTEHVANQKTLSSIAVILDIGAVL